MAAASASLYGHGHAVSSQSIIRHDQPIHYAAPISQYSSSVAHYATPVAHYAAPIAQYAAPIANYDGHDTYVSFYMKSTLFIKFTFNSVRL